MLVLSRNEGQSVLIGDGIKITVVSVRGGQVRFGIEAPPEVVVLRQEIAERDARTDSRPKPTGGPE